MNHRDRLLVARLLVVVALAHDGSWPLQGAALIDDRVITIQSEGDVARKRKVLIEHLWGVEGFPHQKLPDVIVTNIASPVRGLSNLTRVDEFRMNLAPGLEAMAWHFVASPSKGELVVVHHGHACTFDDNPSPDNVGYGLQRTIHALLRDGYGVLAVFMPHMRPGDCTGGHDAMFQTNAAGNPMRHFLEPSAISLNYLKRLKSRNAASAYRAFHMVGLSGGGWTTTVYAAIDPSIQCSISVAGTMPLYLRSGGSIGDREQFEPSFYRLAGYPDLYVLSASAPRRQHWQILVRRDDCCFGEAQHDVVKSSGKPYAQAVRDYELGVQKALKRFESGSFQVVIDDVAPSHMISHHTLQSFILPALRGSN